MPIRTCLTTILALLGFWGTVSRRPIPPSPSRCRSRTRPITPSPWNRRRKSSTKPTTTRTTASSSTASRATACRPISTFPNARPTPGKTAPRHPPAVRHRRQQKDQLHRRDRQAIRRPRLRRPDHRLPQPGRTQRQGEEHARPARPGMGTDQIMHYCGDYSRADRFPRHAARSGQGTARLRRHQLGRHHRHHLCRLRSAHQGDGLHGRRRQLPRALLPPKLAEKIARDGSKSSDPVCHVARIAPRPLLFINVTKDQLIMKPWAESLHKAAGAGSKVVWLETDHYFKGLDRAAVCDVGDRLHGQGTCTQAQTCELS